MEDKKRTGHNHILCQNELRTGSQREGGSARAAHPATDKVRLYENACNLPAVNRYS